jgi:hypothetical protein
MKYKIKAIDLIVLINHLLTSNIEIKLWTVGKLKSNLKSINLNKEYIIEIDRDNEISIIDFISIRDRRFDSCDAYKWKGFGFSRILNI